jgi:hypothetical protein
MSDLDALVEGFAQGMSSQESSGKRVSGSIGVNDLVVGQFRHGVGLGVRFFGMNVALRQRRRRRRNERGFGTLSDDNEARTGGVGFGQVGNRARDLSDARVLLRRGTFSEKLWLISRLGLSTHSHPLTSRISFGFRLVANKDVDIGQELFQLNLEELRDEGSRQIESNNL